MSVTKYKLGSQASLLTTELNSLTNNSAALSAAYNNTQGGGSGDGYVLADLELSVTYGTAPTANTVCSVWFLQTQDGTNYEDGSNTGPIIPGRMPDVVFPLRNVNTAQRIIRTVTIPQGNFKVLLRNDGTGQSMAASGNTLKIRPATYENV